MATVINSVTISPDCKKLTVIATSDAATVTFLYTNLITDNSVTSDSIDVIDGTATWVLSYQTANELFNGVITITEIGDITAPTMYAIGTAEIYCCVAALVQAAIDCHCHCDRCDEDLRKAEKIDLLIKSAQHSAYSSVNVTDAINKYNKAKDFCTETCACGC
jgi:hypothetical protein